MNPSRQALVAAMLHHVVNAVGASHGHGVIGAAIVDNEPLDRVHPGDFPGQRRQGDSEGLRLVITGDLDDDFHGPASGSRGVGTRSSAPTLCPHGSEILSLVWQD